MSLILRLKRLSRCLRGKPLMDVSGLAAVDANMGGITAGSVLETPDGVAELQRRMAEYDKALPGQIRAAIHEVFNDDNEPESPHEPV